MAVRSGEGDHLHARLVTLGSHFLLCPCWISSLEHPSGVKTAAVRGYGACQHPDRPALRIAARAARFLLEEVEEEMEGYGDCGG